jgi:hypothetical protein
MSDTRQLSLRTQGWLMAGLFLATVATLILEILDSRLLSALTWYHLAFLAVSLAMLGMAAGAVIVFLGGEAFDGERAARSLPRYCLWLAISIPVTHIVNLCIPIPTLDSVSPMELAALGAATVALGAPFLLSGIVVTIALTRTGGAIGKLYAADLLGASLGCLLVVPLLASTDISSVAFAAGAIAAAATYCFHRFAGTGGRGAVVLTALLIVASVANARTDQGIGVVYSKNRNLRKDMRVEWSAWNAHSYVIVNSPKKGLPWYWGAGSGIDGLQANSAWVLIDGDAGTPITEWDGDTKSLDWVKYDVTTLPYYLRRGDAGVIGVGGGRDVLSALWGGNAHVTGIEINGNLIRAHTGPYRDFGNFATRPDVELVHDEARSYLSRTDKRFDVLQMSLIDTWAATGAGAFTLSENGLYTLEAWKVFLSTLKPRGVFSVSRWFAPAATSETNRLLALATAALQARGVDTPVDHLMMVASGPVATLMVGEAPFTPEDHRRVQEIADERGFTVLVGSWLSSMDPWLERIVRSRSRAELDAATVDPVFDYSPPSDERPFFFNTLKPGSFHRVYDVVIDGVAFGNLRATWTLITLFGICTVLVAAIIVWPLMRTGLPDMPLDSFLWSVAYFAIIGVGFMLIQIPFLQRFSVYLGHPTYTLAIILFSMIFFAGLGSFISNGFPLGRHPWLLNLPIAIGLATLSMTVLVQPLIDNTIHFGFAARAALVIACIAPIAFLAGFCFPMGMSLVGRLSSHATAWMWGVNGACGVLASIGAVAISMWMGIHMNLVFAGVLYILLTIPARALARRAISTEDPAGSGSRQAARDARGAPAPA